MCEGGSPIPYRLGKEAMVHDSSYLAQTQSCLVYWLVLDLRLMDAILLIPIASHFHITESVDRHRHDLKENSRK